MEWYEKSREQVFKKYSRAIDKVMFEMPDGSEADFYVLDVQPAACIVGITKDNQVVTVRQFRPGVKKTLTELPGGYLGKEEDKTLAAKREFLEETGYTGDFEYIGACLDDAYSNMVRHCFVARNCEKVAEPLNTSREITEVSLLTLDQFRTLLRSGQMTDVEVGYLALDHLKLL